MHAIVYILFSAALLPVVATVSQDPHRLIVRDVAFSLNSALPRHEYFQNSRKCPPSPMLSRMLNGRGRLGLLRLSSSGPNNVRNSAESEEEDYELVECSNYTTIRAVRYGKEEVRRPYLSQLSLIVFPSEFPCRYHSLLRSRAIFEPK